MNLRQVEFSIVVVGQDCNPTILNPDFLRVRGIVPEEWGWEMEGPAITTPAFSTVPYADGIIISVEPQRFLAVDKLKKHGALESKISLLAKKYVATLPHVRYTAVGINFKSFIELASPQTFLKDRFLKDGIWASETHPLQELELSFRYPIQGGKLTLALENAAVREASEGKVKELTGIVLSANFHRDCQGYPAEEQVAAHIEMWVSDFPRYLDMAADILEK